MRFVKHKAKDFVLDLLLQSFIAQIIASNLINILGINIVFVCSLTNIQNFNNLFVRCCTDSFYEGIKINFIYKLIKQFRCRYFYNF